VNIRLPQPLRFTVGGATIVPIEAANMDDLTKQIAARYPELAARVLNGGAFGPFVTVFVDGEDARFLERDADLSKVKTIEILPAMSGGATTEAAPSVFARASKAVHGSFIDETIGIVFRGHPDTIIFAVGSPAAKALEMARTDQLVADVLSRDGVLPLGYGTTEGDDDLREIVASEARSWKIDAPVDGVIITAGALQAIDMTIRLFVQPGDLAVVESPAFANSLSALRNAGARILEVPIDDGGFDPDRARRMLAERGERAKLFLVVPNFQNPSGATMPLARRNELIALAREQGSVIVEDDPYRELRYRGEALSSLASLAPDTVVNIGSFSKTFLPGLRVGWAIAPVQTIHSLAQVKQTMDSNTSMMSQRIVVAFYRRGGVPEHLDALRAMYREKQARARAALTREFAGTGVTWNDPEGGFYFWVRLPGGLSARRLFAAALDERVAFVPGDAFTVEVDQTSNFRFSYSSPTPDRIDEGVRRLRRAFDRISSAATPSGAEAGRGDARRQSSR